MEPVQTVGYIGNRHFPRCIRARINEGRAVQVPEASRFVVCGRGDRVYGRLLRQAAEWGRERTDFELADTSRTSVG